MTRVAIPLSPSKLAVGSVADDRDDFVKIYHQVSRDCCITFYLANRLEEVSPTEHSKPGNITRDKISEKSQSMFRKVVNEFVSDKANVPQEGNQPYTFSGLGAENDPSCRVEFNGFKTDFRRVISSIYKVFDDFPIRLRRLDGITFAVDFAAKLKEVDSTIDSSVEPHPNDHYKLLWVRRGQFIKAHIVLKHCVVDQLISKSETSRDEASWDIRYLLGIISFNELMEEKFPGKVFFGGDQYDERLYQYNDTLLDRYFAIRLAGPRMGKLEFHSEQALSEIENLCLAATNLCNQHITDGNLNLYFEVCSSHVSAFMNAMAEYLAALASVNIIHRTEERVSHELAKLDLVKWLDLFNEDLNLFYRQLIDLSNFDERYFLNRHFERLLLVFDVFPDQLDDGSFVFAISPDTKRRFEQIRGSIRDLSETSWTTTESSETRTDV